MKKPSAALKTRIGRGVSVDALERMWRFYAGYQYILADIPPANNSATLLRILSGPSTQTALSLSRMAERRPLGWSQYSTLLSVTNLDAHRCYEIEATDNGWSVRELKRQMDSALSGWLALSLDSHEARRLSPRRGR